MALLGCGSFGEVYKHVHNGMECAAKKLHAYVSQKAKLNFEKECEYLKKLQHPHIVQFYDVITDQQSGLPVLIMEHMFCNLTHYLHVSTSEEIAYHIQVSICCDVANGLTYLHSHQLAHRDLSSNNILLTDKLCAKIGDFGQAKLLEHCGPHTKTPGTEAYMPPEALQQSAMYDTKIDCYSLGVLAIQIMTKEIPQKEQLELYVEQGTITIPRNYRGKVHGHPLQHIVYKCLGSASYRPTSQQIYCELYKLQHTIINQLTSQNSAQKHDITTLQTEIKKLQQEVTHLKREVLAKDKEIARVKALTQTPQFDQQHMLPTEQGMSKRPGLAETRSHFLSPLQSRNSPIHWSNVCEGPKISRSSNAVLNGTTAYFRASLSEDIYAYETSSCKWSHLPSSKTISCSLVVIGNVLTTIGGYEDGKATNKLFSLTKEWEELLPRMPSKRARSNSVCDEHKLTVAGGEEKSEGERRTALTVVEVMDIPVRQWSRVASLIQPALSASMVICNDRIYILGGWSGPEQTPQTVLTCSVTALYESTAADKIWTLAADLPVMQSTCTTINNLLVAMGGLDANRKLSSNVYVYNESENKWEENSTLSIPRRLCFAISLPNNKILVVGGHTWPGLSEKTGMMELGQ